MHKTLNILKNVVLTGVVFSSVFIIISSVGLFGYKSYVVRSGSMRPHVPVGSLVFDTKATTYTRGDVITFHRVGFSDPITHRIISTKTDSTGNPVYTVKGDANSVADTQPVSASSVIGKVAFIVPFVGYLTMFIKTLPGLIVCIIIPATIIIYHESLSIGKEIATERAKRQKQQTAAARKRSSGTASRKSPSSTSSKQMKSVTRGRTAKAAVGVFLLVASAVMLSGHPSAAYVTDTVTTTGNTTITMAP